MHISRALHASFGSSVNDRGNQQGTLMMVQKFCPMLPRLLTAVVSSTLIGVFVFHTDWPDYFRLLGLTGLVLVVMSAIEHVLRRRKPPAIDPASTK